MTKPRFSRRTLLGTISASAFLASLAPPAAAQSNDALQDWLAAHATPIRTVDPQGEDFSDLEPLAAAIGTARVVQLGEPSHNAGTCFSAKVRLIRFLHQRLNFDVVIWESGIYDVELVEAGLRAGEDPTAAARRGILQNWSWSQECRPLFAYAQQSHATARPLAMAGFDSSLTAPFANLAAELRKYASAMTRQPLQREAAIATEEMIQAFTALTRYVEGLDAINARLTTVGGAARQEALAQWERENAPLRPNRAMLERFQAAHARLAEILRANDNEFTRVAGVRQSGFMRRVVDSLSARGANLYERFGTDVSPASDGGLAEQNRRDARNAENLRWLIEQGYPGRKVIIWAHNAHVMNAYYDAPAFKTIRLAPAASTMKPHGVFLAEWLGRDLYTIGFTACEGEDGWMHMSSVPAIPAARAESLEGRLKRLGHPYAFVDMRGTPGAAQALRGTQIMRVPKYDEVEIANPARPYDGLFFIARMGRATLIPS